MYSLSQWQGLYSRSLGFAAFFTFTAIVSSMGCGVKEEESLPVSAGTVTQATTASWAATASMSIDRYRATNIRLHSGKLLVAGGASNSNSYLASTEIYDPATGSWSMSAPMASSRERHAAALLANGKVLVVGGYAAYGMVMTATAELYDPATNSWSSAGSMSASRAGFTATLLNNGKVLVAGGHSSTAEMYDPINNSWSLAGALSGTRLHPTATLLPNGKVLVTGGWDGTTDAGRPTPVRSAQLYDPMTNSWSAAASMATPRWDHTATLLPNGKVLVTGGRGVATTELYDPTTNTWSSAGSMSTIRSFHVATLVNGKVLVSGGQDSAFSMQTADLYDPATNSWMPTASMAFARQWHGAVVLLDGKVLVTGGDWLGSAELYTPSTSSPVGNNVAQGSTCNAADVFTPSCSYSYSPEGSIIWTAPYSGTFTFTTTGSDFDTILEIMDDNTSNSLGCNDDANGTSQSALTRTLVAGQRIKVMIDGYSWSCGNYTLNVQ